MIRKPPPVTTPEEETADFRKPDQVTTQAYVNSYKDFLRATSALKPQLFLNYCLAVINQKNSGALSIRESAFAMSSGIDQTGLDVGATSIVTEAQSLRRHPQNYRAEHTVGWVKLVERITKLRKRT